MTTLEDGFQFSFQAYLIIRLLLYFVFKLINIIISAKGQQSYRKVLISDHYCTLL